MQHQVNIQRDGKPIQITHKQNLRQRKQLRSKTVKYIATTSRHITQKDVRVIVTFPMFLNIKSQQNESTFTHTHTKNKKRGGGMGA